MSNSISVIRGSFALEKRFSMERVARLPRDVATASGLAQFRERLRDALGHRV